MKKNNSLLITILGGAIFCFVCLGMVFLFPSSTKKLNSSNESAFPNADEHGYVPDEEISLGDTGGYCTTGSAYSTNPSCAGISCSGYGQSQCSSSTYGCCTWKAESSSPVLCWQLTQGSQCSQLTVTGSCTGTNYSDKSSCVAALNCGSQYKEGASCHSCGDGYIADHLNCTGTQETCCKKITTTCWTLTQGDKCTQNTVDGSSCTGSNYESQSACETALNCGTNKYKNGTACYSCTNGKPKSSNCTGTEATCCEKTCDIPKCTGFESGDSCKCNSCSGWYKPSDDKTSCVKDVSKVPSTCCETLSTGTKVTISSQSGCQQAFLNGANVVAGACIVSEKCKAGTYEDSDGTCKTCEAGYWSNDGAMNCSKCPEGQTSDAGAKGVTSCYNTFTLTGDTSTAYVTPGTCKTYAFSVKYNNGTEVTSGASWYITNASKVSGCDGGHSCVIKVCGDGCKQVPAASVSVTIGNASASKTVGRVSYKEWDPTAWNKEPAQTACDGKACIYNGTALDQDVCIAYDDIYIENGVTKYKKQYNRCCYSGGGTSTPTPSIPEVPHCYVDNDGEYHWTTNAEPSWKEENTITKEVSCQKEETPACYISPSGEYTWGKHAKEDDYTLITAITDSNSCKTPTPEEACYMKDGDYKWTSTPPEGYAVVEGATKPADCTPPENPACYLHGNSFVWGKYEKITGYIFVENINEEKYCKTPDNDACYVDSKGDYVWGKYGDAEGYTLVPSVTEMSQCKNDVPTPKTDISISKIIYIFMAILMAFGVGFIYYSSTTKKSS